MPLVEAIPLTDFVHGAIEAHEGRPVWMEKATADALEQAQLVRIRLEHAKPVMGKDVPGKAQDDGKGQPSSVSHPAPASPATTSATSTPGSRKTRKTAAS